MLQHSEIGLHNRFTWYVDHTPEHALLGGTSNNLMVRKYFPTKEIDAGCNGAERNFAGMQSKPKRLPEKEFD